MCRSVTRCLTRDASAQGSFNSRRRKGRGSYGQPSLDRRWYHGDHADHPADEPDCTPHTQRTWWMPTWGPVPVRKWRRVRPGATTRTSPRERILLPASHCWRHHWCSDFPRQQKQGHHQRTEPQRSVENVSTTHQGLLDVRRPPPVHHGLGHDQHCWQRVPRLMLSGTSKGSAAKNLLDTYSY